MTAERPREPEKRTHGEAAPRPIGTSVEPGDRRGEGKAGPIVAPADDDVLASDALHRIATRALVGALVSAPPGALVLALAMGLDPHARVGDALGSLPYTLVGMAVFAGGVTLFLLLCAVNGAQRSGSLPYAIVGIVGMITAIGAALPLGDALEARLTRAPRPLDRRVPGEWFLERLFDHDSPGELDRASLGDSTSASPTKEENVIKKVLAVLGIVTAAGAPVLYAAARSGSPNTKADAVAPTTSAQQVEDTIICPLTGEGISPCCCPVNGKKKD